MPMPPYHALFNPVLAAIKRLGDSATIAELDDEVIKELGLTETELATPHGERLTEIQYRLAWARSYLKAYGFLDNSSRGVWVLTPKGKEATTVDPSEVVRFVRGLGKGRKASNPTVGSQDVPSQEDGENGGSDDGWRDELLAVLRNLPPAAFERLCQRLLRESGFVEVRVTGQTGDGGIDGVGIVRLGGLLGFPVLFQCKRFRGSVGAGVIRDFRGAMVGRTDRGLVLTTGTFTHEARQEATRDGAPPIDLVDGEQLLDKLKELGLGVKVHLIEQVRILPVFFEDI